MSKHLALLERAGVVAMRRAGRESHYAIRPDGLSGARRYLDEVSQQRNAAIERIRTRVEE